ncbi:unnamed protein product, partial [Acanthoscelides obtectus]
VLFVQRINRYSKVPSIATQTATRRHFTCDFIVKISAYMISGFPFATAQVAGPNLAPFFKKHLTTFAFLQPTALSKGLTPFASTCSTAAPVSIKNCTKVNSYGHLTYPTTLSLPSLAACTKGHRPAVSALPGEAPAATSCLTTSQWPFAEAKDKAAEVRTRSLVSPFGRPRTTRRHEEERRGAQIIVMAKQQPSALKLCLSIEAMDG